ncbi:MAG TPA: 16S rRNA (cytosine(967)-C(5))-methyltransferase RsmB [Nitrospirota bacterium]|nr:16S rRNA (cytosine(967)-C(5))-methyltransferase RsmB [Nitrospirota bacterium]
MRRADKPREKALSILRCAEAGTYADALIDKARQIFDERDSGFILELVYGILRNQTRLDWIIDLFSEQPIAFTDSWTRNILRLGAYQLLFLDRIPISAIVNTATELAKTYGKKSGYVNGLLRNLDRKRNTITYPTSEDPIRQLSIMHSHPAWLVRRWVEQFGIEKAESILQKNNRPAPLIIRTNILKATRDELKVSLISEGTEVAETPYSPIGLQVISSPGLHRLSAYKQGWFIIQDQAAQLISMLLSPSPGEMVLDACAAPGGKVTHLAEMMKNRGTLIALEKDSDRLTKIQENSKRLGLTNIIPKLQDASRYQEGRYDKILIDAPCSGLGILRRHPDGRWTKTENLIMARRRIQERILENCSKLLKPGGALVYATCTTELEENEEVLSVFLAGAGKEFEIEDARSFLPKAAVKFVNEKKFFHTYPLAPEMDGFFGARLKKKK